MIPAFADPLKRRRCLISADGFYHEQAPQAFGERLQFVESEQRCIEVSNPFPKDRLRSIPQSLVFFGTVDSKHAGGGYGSVWRSRSPGSAPNSLTLECIRGLILLMVTNGTLRCGGLAKATGVSADRIRHYERIGVLPKAERTASGYRVYSAGAIERVEIVQRALRIGFTLSELADIFRTRDSGGAPCERVFQLAEEKLAGIHADMAALKKAEKYRRRF